MLLPLLLVLNCVPLDLIMELLFLSELHIHLTLKILIHLSSLLVNLDLLSDS